MRSRRRVRRARRSGPRTKQNGPGDRVVFVTTTGRGSLDRYSQKLAEHLGVETLRTDVYQRTTAELFNAPLVSVRSLRGLSSDVAFARRLRRQRALLHLPNHHLGRYGHALSQPYVVTVHDLIRYFDANGSARFIHPPNLRDRLWLRLDFAGISRATAIISVSKTTKRDLVEQLSVPEERISVVYEGVDHALFRPVERRLVDEPYVLFVGSEHPRKNLTTVLRAVSALKREPGFERLRLVKVGAAGGPEAPFREQTKAVVRELGLERDVLFTGRVPDEDMPAYYSGAACLVLPSLYEGFGFPPLEAMACGCPVIVSTGGALPEIAGPAALTVEPRDVGALAMAIRSLVEDVATASSLRARGLAHARLFTWERAARETEMVYEAVQRGFSERSEAIPSRPPVPRPRAAEQPLSVLPLVQEKSAGRRQPL